MNTQAVEAQQKIPASSYDFARFPEIRLFQAQHHQIAKAGVADPYFKVNESIVNNMTRIEGKDYISYSSYNYLGLSGHPAVTEAAKAALDQYGSSVSASRIATGEKPIHRELEDELAQTIGAEASIVLVSGHATNVTVIGHLFDKQDLIIYDKLSHNSILEGIVLSGAKHLSFAHNDTAALAHILERFRHKYRRVLIVIEGVYSMDGDIADLPEFIALKKKHKALLMVDEAHSFGVIGKTGRGVREHFDVDSADVDIWMGTLSKAMASCGGYIAGKTAFIQYLKYTVPGFMYSVGIPPASAAAALQALRVMNQEPDRVQRLQHNAQLFLRLLQEKGYPTGLAQNSAIVPLIVGDSVQCLHLADLLFKRGINVQPILAPVVAENEARLRFFITSDHTEVQLRETVRLIEVCKQELGLALGA